jgi:hypothetical protein
MSADMAAQDVLRASMIRTAERRDDIDTRPPSEAILGASSGPSDAHDLYMNQRFADFPRRL